MDLSPLILLFSFLLLAGIIGYFVVWGVTPALHTPLMAVTNAISGIVILAAIIVAGSGIVLPTLCPPSGCEAVGGSGTYQLAAKIVGFFAVVLCAINIFGGFAITSRMLAMFRPREKPADKAGK